MPDDTDYIDRTEELTPAARQAERRMIRNGLGWWFAALAVVIAALLALVLMTSRMDEASVDRARDIALTQESLDNATTDAQLAALKASRAAQSAVTQSAAATDGAARSAVELTVSVVEAANERAEDAANPALDDTIP